MNDNQTINPESSQLQKFNQADELTGLNILPVDLFSAESIQDKIDQKTKPVGALGQLEKLAKQIALIQSGKNRERLSLQDQQAIQINKPVMLVFAGDHGIAEEGISIAPSAVTQQMVVNFLNGGAAINCFCRANDMTLEVIDAGILIPIEDKRLNNQSLGHGTQNFSKTTAMSKKHVNQGLAFGEKVANKHIQQGSNVLGFGEMGIANTSSASAIMAAVLGLTAQQCVGRGTGIDDKTLHKKIDLIDQALHLHHKNINSPIDILACLGGFEIVQIVGAMLAAAEKNCVILVDGFITTAAALVASKFNKNVLDYMVFCHQSDEKGHQLMLSSLNATPLLSLGLRLGEGTGAALALPLLRAAASFYNDMASFESAGVDAV